MTAQVVIFTSSCAVLAADSAVTVSGSAEEKVYNGVEKIIPLSASEPLAALIYGTASIARVPWGTLIHAFSSEADLSGMSLPEVAAELAVFVNVRLHGHLAQFGEAARQEQAYETLAAIAHEARYISGVESVEEMAGSDDWLRAVGEIAPREVERWSAQDLVVGIENAARERELHSEARDWADMYADELFEGHATVSSPTRAAVRRLLLLSATRRNPPGFESTRTGGVVIIGFGAGEFWPGYCELEFDGVGLDGVRVWLSDADSSDGPGRAWVQAFAQSSGVSTLMDGMHPTLRQLVGGAMVDAGLDDEEASEALAKAEQSWFEARIGRIMRTLDSMPAPALCEIAESLVAITALEHRMTGSLETVGGTISVGVLAPGEPLRWGKRPSLMSA